MMLNYIVRHKGEPGPVVATTFVTRHTCNDVYAAMTSLGHNSLQL